MTTTDHVRSLDDATLRWIYSSLSLSLSSSISLFHPSFLLPPAVATYIIPFCILHSRCCKNDVAPSHRCNPISPFLLRRQIKRSALPPLPPPNKCLRGVVSYSSIVRATSSSRSPPLPDLIDKFTPSFRLDFS